VDDGGRGGVRAGGVAGAGAPAADAGAALERAVWALVALMPSDAPKCEMGDWYEVRDVQTNQRGLMPTFDEIVTGPVDAIHIEQLSDQTYWMGICKGSERLVVVFSSKGGRAHVTGRFEVEDA
jgi:hypothetical protein